MQRFAGKEGVRRRCTCGQKVRKRVAPRPERIAALLEDYLKSRVADQEELRLFEAVAARAELNPEAVFLDKERVAYLENTIENELSAFEKQVLDLYMTGMSYTQIAKVLGRDEKSTDNALQRLKSKIRKRL